ncbi:polysaccharide deacetylase family protein [Enterococcus hirae]|uniref:polysaccharide deacetylase family protein n=1 Tax=Enterococcus hirae TaxID=1354 RepID=UPI00207340FE|nr:polysaccharide deacetylase family protein [Enterococcus hirae]
MTRKNKLFFVLIFGGILILGMQVFSRTTNFLDNGSLKISSQSMDKNILVKENPSKKENTSKTESFDSNKIKNLERAVAITFDDGPNEITTLQVLDILKDKNVQATFFMLGENVIKNKGIVKRISKSGHEIGNHSFSHKQLTLLSNEEIKRELGKTDQAIYKATGQMPQYIRPPYGSIDKNVAEIGKRPFIEWSVDSRDWESKNKESIIEEIKNQVYSGSILLFHDIQPATVEALPEVIDDLYSQNYEFFTISQLLQSPKQVINYYGINDHRGIME